LPGESTSKVAMIGAWSLYSAARLGLVQAITGCVSSAKFPRCGRSVSRSSGRERPRRNCARRATSNCDGRVRRLYEGMNRSMNQIYEGCDERELQLLRSEERRVGKECRSRWSTYHEKKKHKKRMAY